MRRLAAVDDLDVAGQRVEQFARREPVDHDHVGGVDQPAAAHGDQVGVTRAATDEARPSRVAGSDG